MSLAENDDVIQALAADRPDQPFGNAVVKSSQLHSYRLIRRKPFTHVFHPKSVSWTVDIVLPDGSLNLYALVHGG